MKKAAFILSLIVGSALISSPGESWETAEAARVFPPDPKPVQNKPAKKLGIKNTVFSGSGCVAGSVASQVTPDNTQFTLIFDNYIVEKNAGVRAAGASCEVRVNLDIPDGWQYTLVSAEFSGYYYLETGVSATQNAEYHFLNSGKAASKNRGRADSSFHGPADESYFRTDIVPVRGAQWSPCTKGDRSIVISTNLNVSGKPAGYGYISLDLMSAAISEKQAHRYLVKWQPCMDGKLKTQPGSTM